MESTNTGMNHRVRFVHVRKFRVSSDGFPRSSKTPIAGPGTYGSIGNIQNRTITLRLSLIPVCALLAAACATMPDQPPDAPLPPVQSPAAGHAAEACRRISAQQAQAQAAQALEQALGPARQSRLGCTACWAFRSIPPPASSATWRTKRYAAFADPGFVLQLVPGLS